MNNKPNIKIGYLNITDHLILGITERKILKREEIFKYANLSTTQLYLGKVSDTEALKWIENIYG